MSKRFNCLSILRYFFFFVFSVFLFISSSFISLTHKFNCFFKNTKVYCFSSLKRKFCKKWYYSFIDYPSITNKQASFVSSLFASISSILITEFSWTMKIHNFTYHIEDIYVI